MAVDAVDASTAPDVLETATPEYGHELVIHLETKQEVADLSQHTLLRQWSRSQLQYGR